MADTRIEEFGQNKDRPLGNVVFSVYKIRAVVKSSILTDTNCSNIFTLVNNASKTLGVIYR